MFAIYNNVTRGSLIKFFLYVSLFLLLFLSFFFPFFVFYSSSYCLFKPSNYIITIIIAIMFINITVMGVLEKSSGAEFQARNSRGMVYPYSSR